MCTLLASCAANGRRWAPTKGFTADAAATFFGVLQSVESMRPRVEMCEA